MNKNLIISKAKQTTLDFLKCLFAFFVFIILTIAPIIILISVPIIIFTEEKCESNCFKKTCYPSIHDKLTGDEYPCVCHVDASTSKQDLNYSF